MMFKTGVYLLPCPSKIIQLDCYHNPFGVAVVPSSERRLADEILSSSVLSRDLVKLVSLDRSVLSYVCVWGPKFRPPGNFRGNRTRDLVISSQKL